MSSYPTSYFALAYHIWHMGVSLPFMIHIRHWPLSWRSNLQGFLYDFMFCATDIFFILFRWHSHIRCRILLWPLLNIGLWYQYLSYTFTVNLSLGKVAFALWHRNNNLAHWYIMHINIAYLLRKKHVTYNTQYICVWSKERCHYIWYIPPVRYTK